MRLLLNGYLGWFAFLPRGVTAVMVLLMVLGVRSATKTAARGSVLVLAALPIASVGAGLPMCASRLTLFTQFHIQIVCIIGFLRAWLWVGTRVKRPVVWFVPLSLFSLGVAGAGVTSFFHELFMPPYEDLRPMLHLMNPIVTNRVWVEHQSVPQVMTLPEALPVKEVLYSYTVSPEKIPEGWTYILWTHLDDHSLLNIAKVRALQWEVVYSGRAAGLALARF